MRIVPLRLDADGVHRLTVNLHPADLGPVQVVAEIRNGDINLQLAGTTDAGNAALRDSLADLKRELNQVRLLEHHARSAPGPRSAGPGPAAAVSWRTAATAPGRTRPAPARRPRTRPATPEPTGPDPDGRLDIKA